MVQHTLLLGDASHAQALWVLVGMGSLLAATTHAPAMSAIMVFEITRNYNVVLAAMPACVVASVVGSLLRERSVYAEALGLKEQAGSKTSLFEAITGRKPAAEAQAGETEGAPPDLKPRNADQSRD